ncbi:harbinger transposase-derived nuclease domain-containing protein [Artemisia annua]|uniref:Harbinger transposase-derived nuclease domain-containing protein n=1 Tax=Artemisia annua TaxID=35608 RepID=A0A2U1P2W3_ARTAN|nr:harbinger transposase-derived nuclease domain-containing protein [Artemisia annua]
MLHRQQVREGMLNYLSTSGRCRDLIRMSENAFKILCQKLESDGGLRPTQRMTIEEQVARFLHIVGNDFRNHFVSWCYRRSGSATSRHFHRVLNAIISLEDHYIKQPSGDTEDRDRELEDEVMHELLNAPQDEEPQAPRGIDDGGEEIRNSIANEMWNEYLLHPNNEINMSN